VYDPRAVLAAVDAHTIGVLVLGAITFAGVYTWLIGAMRAGRRDRVYPLPVFCIAFWFAHDTSFVASYHNWFVTYDHWFMKLFWVAVASMIVMEFEFMRQIVRFGGTELFPQLSARACTVLLGAALVSGIVIWSAIKMALVDDLYLIAFGLTVAVYPPFAIAMMLRRGSTLGQSVPMWCGFCGLAVGLFTLTSTYFGPAFHTWQWISLGVFSVLGGVAGLWTVVGGHRYGLVTRPPAVGRRERTLAS
jgi:hypothetical protein